MHKIIHILARSIVIPLTVMMVLTLTSCSLVRPSHTVEITRVQQIANELGRTDANLLAEFEACWDMNSECGYRLYFTSQDNANVIQTRLSSLGASVNQHAEGVATADSSIGMLPLHRAKQLKTTGTNPSSDAHTAGAISWNGKDKSGGPFNVRLYRLQVWPKTYSFDDKPITGNVIEVLVRYPNSNP